MTLYEINSEIQKVINEMEVDEETGEVNFDVESFNKLQIDKNDKVEGLACYIKNLSSFINEIDTEITNLEKRQKTLSNKCEKLKNYLKDNLENGENFETAKCKISWRKSESTNVDEEEFLKYHKDMCTPITTYKYNKKDLKSLVKNGAELHGVTIVTNYNMSIK